MASFIELIAKIKQKNNGTFKLVDAQDVECEDDKGLDEVLNEKLDKNQGIENAGKTMVVGDDGNLVVGDSSPKNVYTKEEVDYMLADKMDKPYVPIEITDSATLDDCLAGNFKIDKIKGNTYQKVETDILPTPSRPVPINSRKVKVNSEYVELRSLKETGNLFDINFIKLLGNYSDSMTILDDGTVKVTNNDATLRPLKTKSITIPKSANYTIKYDFETISGGANSGWISLVNMSNDNSKIFSTSGKTLYLDAGDYYVRFYRGQGATDVENNIVQYSNIVLVEGTSAPSTYVPPTVRDYKIVDHTAKTAKIVRNVHTTSFNKNSEWSRTGDDKKGYRFVVVENQPVKVLNYSEVNNGFSNMSNNAKNSVVNDNKSGSGWYCTSNSYAIKVDGLQMGTLDDFKQLLGDNEIIFQCQLQTPTEESITYVETDVSEVGYSWQDTTSPSPTIKSEVKGVEKIDVLKTGKNLFDFSKVKTNYDLTIDYENKTITIPPKTNNAGYVNNLKDLMGGYKIGEKYVMSAKTSNIEARRIIYFLDIKSSIKFDEPFTLTEEMLNTPFAWYNNNESKNQNVISNIQIEQGDTATPYEPYQEQHVNITPPQPLYSTVDGSIADEADVEKGVYRYWLLRDKIENVISSVTVGESKDGIRKWFTSDIKNKSLIPITLNGTYDTRNLVCTNFIANIEKYRNASNETFSMYEDKTAMFVGSINVNRLNEDSREDIYNFIKDFEIVYPLLTPVEIPIPEEDLAKLKSLRTNAGVNKFFINGEVKPTIEARYPRDLALVQQQLEQKILLISDSLIDTQAKLLLQGGN